MAPNHMAMALSSGAFSDCSIECGNQIFNVHKVVLCTQSPVFHAAFVENHEGIKMEPFKIDRFSVDTVQAMLRFMYGEKDVWHQKATNDTAADNGEAASKEAADNMTISTLLELAITAHFFKVESFRDAVNHEIETLLRQKWCDSMFRVAAGVVAASEVDEALQKLMCQIAADHVNDLAEKSIDLGGLMKLEGAAMEFVNACASRLDKTTCHLKTRLDLVTKKLKTATNLLKAKEEALARSLKDNDEVIAGVAKSIKLLNNDDECSYCQDDFGWHVETTDYKTYSVFCRECNRRKSTE